MAVAVTRERSAVLQAFYPAAGVALAVVGIASIVRDWLGMNPSHLVHQTMMGVALLVPGLIFWRSRRNVRRGRAGIQLAVALLLIHAIGQVVTPAGTFDGFGPAAGAVLAAVAIVAVAAYPRPAELASFRGEDLRAEGEVPGSRVGRILQAVLCALPALAFFRFAGPVAVHGILDPAFAGEHAVHSYAELTVAVLLVGVGLLRLALNPRRVAIAQATAITTLFMAVSIVAAVAYEPSGLGGYAPFIGLMALALIGVIGLGPDRRALFRLD